MTRTGWVALFASTILAALSAGAAGQSATFRSESRYIDDEGRTTTIVRSLRLESGGRAELTTSCRDDKPVLTRNLVWRHGELMAEMTRYGSIRHLGGWSREGDRLPVDLDRLETGSGSVRQNAAFRFRVSGRDLRVERQDQEWYGTADIGFSRLSGNIDDLIHSPSVLVGEYHWRYRVRWDGGGYTLTRVLRLERGGRAELVSEISGSAPASTASERDRLGRLMDRLRDNRRVRHTGEWRLGEEGVVVSLRSVEPGSNVDARMVFERTPGGVRQRTTASAYGQTRMVMGRGAAGVVDGGTWDLPNVVRPPAGEAPRPGTGTRPETFAGTYEATFEVRNRGTLIRTLVLNEDGTVSLRSEFRGPTEEPFGADLLRTHGTILDMLRSQRTVVLRGTWTADNRLLTLRFSAIEGQSRGSRMVLRSVPAGGAFHVLEYSRELFGQRHFNFARR